MRLAVLTPTDVLLEADVAQVTAEAENGSFSLLPRHVDFVAALVPGLLAWVDVAGGETRWLAVDEGILVKCGDDVLVSVRRAVRGPDLEALHRTVAEQFRRIDEHERTARSALARLEAAAIRRFAQLDESRRG
jgi:F-type H+-transporting ATPase subunit epsilon